MRQLALIAERIDRTCRDAQKRRDFACRQQPVSKRERKWCQILMTRGIAGRDLSNVGDNLRRLATPSDKRNRPFKPRVVGSIPTRLTLEARFSLGKLWGASGREARAASSSANCQQTERDFSVRSVRRHRASRRRRGRFRPQLRSTRWAAAHICVFVLLDVRRSPALAAATGVLV